MENSKNSLIITILNRGFSEIFMNAARECGARGGTILHGRGTGAKELMKFYNIVLEQEKEIILVVASEAKRKQIMEGIMRAVGLGTDAHGITFTLPVENFMLLQIDDDEKTQHEIEEKETQQELEEKKAQQAEEKTAPPEEV